MADWDDVVALGRGLMEVEESTSYNTPALKVRGRLFVRLRSEAEGALVVMCGLDEKEALLASGDPAFFTTAHYDGYGAVLVDLERVGHGELAELVTEAWRIKAPARLRRRFDAGQAPGP
ncbi:MULTISPECIES: MmcQ/YjbR family DNA-binding protein [Streptomonospora]|uniref:MmcQ/YjbR family DNA-binding protein n=2 Tax=Streptomonospora TaxID=104204 RepID=A0ABV9SR67_9ACTN